MSQQIHPRIDNSVYLALKSKDINISSTVNSLLKNFVEQENVETDKSKILDNISNLKAQIKEINSKLETEVVKLQVVQEREQREQKEHDIKMKQFIASMRHNNPARDM